MYEGGGARIVCQIYKYTYVPDSGDVSLDHVLPLQLAHVVDHLVVKVGVVAWFWGSAVVVTET